MSVYNIVFMLDILHMVLEFRVFITCICVGIHYGNTITTGAFTFNRYLIREPRERDGGKNRGHKTRTLYPTSRRYQCY